MIGAMHAKTFFRAEKLRMIVDVGGPMAGVDEVGRGPLAGPVVAAAVILAEKTTIRGLNDSKKLQPEERERLDVEIRRRALCCCVAEASVEEIDRFNILRATFMAMRRAFESLPVQPEQALIDGNMKPGLPVPETTVVEGDHLSYSIAAASILAKVARDKMMRDLHLEHPRYGWEHNAGYGTAEHRAAIEAYGLTPHHRVSFKPVYEQLSLID